MTRSTLKQFARTAFLFVAAWVTISFIGLLMKTASTSFWVASLFGSLTTSLLIFPMPLIFDDPPPDDASTEAPPPMHSPRRSPVSRAPRVRRNQPQS